MVRDRLIVRIPAVPDRLPCRPGEDFLRKVRDLRSFSGTGSAEFCKPVQVPRNLLGHRGREHTGICSRVGRELLLVKLLRDLKRLVGRDPEHFGAVILQLRKVVEHGRIFLLLLPADAQDMPLIRVCLFQHANEVLRILPLLKSVVLIELREERTLRIRLPLCLDASENTDDPVERRFDELPDLPLSADDHPENTGHDPADCDGLPFSAEVIRDRIAILERQDAGEIDSHEVVFLRPEIGGVAQRIVRRERLCLPDPARDLLVGKGVDPDTPAVFFRDAGIGHHLGKTVNVLSLPPGVSADINDPDVLPGEQPADCLELFCHCGNDLIPELIRQEGQGVKAPLLVLDVIFFRVAHRDEMPDAPRHDMGSGLDIAVAPRTADAKSAGEFKRNAGFLRYKK